MAASRQPLKRFSAWFLDRCLPLWAASGYDHARGGFYESLDFDGAPVTDQPRRVRVQARQIHTFSQAAFRGWTPGGEDLAAKGFDHFLKFCCPENGARGCVHMIDDDGRTLDDRRDLYDQAFLLLACASRWQAAKDDRALHLADRTIEFLDKELASPHGGWMESDKGELPRRQNPHMHLFEAFMTLYRVTENPAYFEKAKQVLHDCFYAAFDLVDGVITEFFNEDWSQDQKRKSIEPGHMFEWVWLLRRWEVCSEEDFSDARNTLYNRGVHFGEDPKFFGFVANQVDITKPQQRGAKRLWPQTEYLKASCVQARSGDTHAKTRIASLIDDMFSSYLKVKTPGLWMDEFDAHGAPAAKDAPASILYHLLEAVAETIEYEQSTETA